MPDVQPTKSNPPAKAPLGVRVIGVLLLLSSVGLVSCQALFTW